MLRLFVAINLPEKIKQELKNYQAEISDLPAKWVKPENLHLTLVFLGNQKEENLGKIFEAIERTVQKFQPFVLKITQACFAPPKMKVPRMVWVLLEKNKTLENLFQDLIQNLTSANIPFLHEQGAFLPHVTLCRLRKWEFQRMDPEFLPQVNKEFNFAFEVSSVELMESKLKRTGPEYFVLKGFPLKK